MIQATEISFSLSLPLSFAPFIPFLKETAGEEETLALWKALGVCCVSAKKLYSPVGHEVQNLLSPIGGWFLLRSWRFRWNRLSFRVVKGFDERMNKSNIVRWDQIFIYEWNFVLWLEYKLILQIDGSRIDHIIQIISTELTTFERRKRENKGASVFARRPKIALLRQSRPYVFALISFKSDLHVWGKKDRISRKKWGSLERT